MCLLGNSARTLGLGETCCALRSLVKLNAFWGSWGNLLRLWVSGRLAAHLGSLEALAGDAPDYFSPAQSLEEPLSVDPQRSPLRPLLEMLPSLEPRWVDPQHSPLRPQVSFSAP